MANTLIQRLLGQFLPSSTSVSPPQASLENPSVSLSQAIDLLTWGSGTNYGPVINASTALTVPAVYRCISLRAGVIGAMPLKVYRRTAKGREEVPLHAVAKLFRNGPNPKRPMTAMTWLEQIVFHLDTYGNAYGIVRYSQAAKVIGVDPVHPSEVSVEELTNGRLRYTVQGENRPKELIDQDDMLHVRAPAPGCGGILGISKVEVARDAIALAKVLETRTAEAHQNAASPSGMMTIPKMASESLRRFKAQFLSSNTGAGSAGKVIFADDGAKFQKFELTPVELGTSEQRMRCNLEIARVWGVPGSLILEQEKSTSWGSGLAEGHLAWLSYGLNADLSRIEAEFNRVLLPAGDLYCEFQRLNILQLNPVQAAEVMRVELAAGILTINEARAACNRPAVPGGDEIYLNGSNQLLDNLINPPAPPSVAAPAPEEPTNAV